MSVHFVTTYQPIHWVFNKYRKDRQNEYYKPKAVLKFVTYFLSIHDIQITAQIL